MFYQLIFRKVISYLGDKQNRTECDIYFNLSIYIQLIVVNKTYIHGMHK